MITVCVLDEANRPTYRMAYRDPQTGQLIRRTTGVPKGGRARYRQAERAAAKWEADLNAGRPGNDGRLGWEIFRDRFEAEVLPGLADKSQLAYGTAFNALERLTGPQYLSNVTGPALSQFAARLRSEGKSEASIASYLRLLHAAMSWAHEQLEVLPRMPRFPKAKRDPTRRRKMKGRPITEQEFEQMLAAAAEVVGDRADAYRWFLRGLYWSGLRLDEGVNLWWTPPASDPHALVVHLDGERSTFFVPCERDKGGEDRALPMAPEFVEMLEEVPPANRQGRVFKLTGNRGQPSTSIHGIGARVSKIGKAAGIITRPRSKHRHATAHDLRRSFGTRWAPRVTPLVLQAMMRHKSIATTQNYYVALEGGALAETIWRAYRSVSLLVSQQPRTRKKGQS